MTFSIYLDEAQTSALNDAAKRCGRSRNALIRQALAEWLRQHRAAKWPDTILAHKGVRNAARFEAYRKNLKPPREPFRRTSR